MLFVAPPRARPMGRLVAAAAGAAGAAATGREP
jgi:hypothetical protein